jgi:hypothetical protein
MSLGRAFMLAGVPSLVMSLWAVNDQSTGFIMKQFYQKLAENKDKAQALQSAKLAYLETSSGIAAHPAFWAPFVQFGDIRPISIQQSTIKWGLWAGLGGAVLAAGFLFIRLRRRLA